MKMVSSGISIYISKYISIYVIINNDIFIFTIIIIPMVLVIP